MSITKVIGRTDYGYVIIEKIIERDSLLIASSGAEMDRKSVKQLIKKLEEFVNQPEGK